MTKRINEGRIAERTNRGGPGKDLLNIVLNRVSDLVSASKVNLFSRILHLQCKFCKLTSIACNRTSQTLETCVQCGTLVVKQLQTLEIK